MTNIVRIKEGEYYPSKDFKEVKEVIQPKHELIQQKTISVSRMSNGKLRCSSMSKLLYKSGFEGGQYIDFKQIEKGLVIYASTRDTEHKIYSVVNKGSCLLFPFHSLCIQNQFLLSQLQYYSC